ncbi:GNAT family N-acetyltransferase [Streptomyces sp. NPDC047108]|uniref:GNAT family N-acetyltransferase n=1 Tax=Streptomyces sp. NPDC047108 TaxID=3155025 RepID=UPI0033F15CBE
MPSLTPPVVPAGRLGRSEQPSLTVPGGLRLRPWRPTDAPAVVAAFTDPAIQQWHVRRADSEEEAGEWIARWRQAWRSETGAHWAIVRAGDDTVRGRVALRTMSLVDGQAECAYWTTASARGAGVAPRAVTALAAWALEEVGFHRLELAHSVANPASCRVALKAGFAHESTRRHALLHPDGWHDMHVHVLIGGDGPAPGTAPADPHPRPRPRPAD